MHDSVLNEALKRLAAEASTRFTSLVATGDEIPFDVAENNGDSSHFYRYVPLTSNFIASHAGELKSLPGYGPARGAVVSAGVAAPYLESRGVSVPSDPDLRAEEMLEIFVTELWEGTTGFSLDLSRVEDALSRLEVAARDIREADVLIAPLAGFEMTPNEVEFTSGIRIVSADSVDAPLEATSSEGSDRNAWQPAYLAMAPLGDSPDGPRRAVAGLHGLIKALRLFKEGSVGLGPYAFAPVGENAWRRIETGAAPARPGSYFLVESEVELLDDFMLELADSSPRLDRISFAEQRFQFGLERSRPLDALSDNLLAIRSALGGEGVIDAPLAARAAALLTGGAEDKLAISRIEAAMDLEQSLINGEDVMTAGNESSSYLAAWIEDSARHILREAVLGHYGENLNITAEETLITSGLTAGESSATQLGSTAEWDIPAPADSVSAPVEQAGRAIVADDTGEGAEIHVLHPRATESFGPKEEAGVDPLFGSVPEFEPEPLPDRIESMPEVEAALGIDREIEISHEVPEYAPDAPVDEYTPDDGAPAEYVPPFSSEEADTGATRLLEPVPDPGEITVSASSEIGATLREDWLGETRSGSTIEWPAPPSSRSLRDYNRDEHPPRDPRLFPSPETTEWSIGELNYQRKRPTG
jgi:hypothetical protein